MKIKVFHLSLKEETPNTDYWDFGFINDYFSGGVWQAPNQPEYERISVKLLTKEDRAIVTLPARHHADKLEEVNKELSKINHVILFLMGDEEADFPVERIKHDSIHIWVQNPHPGRHDSYNKLGTGYPIQSQPILEDCNHNKDLDLYFSGQITHQRRFSMWDNLLAYQTHNNNVEINKTEGFTQGVPHDEYFRKMARTKIVPCPAGAVIPDSFRLFEALESMAVPIADDMNTKGDVINYWDWLFGESVPFIKIYKWKELFEKAEEILRDYPEISHEITAWWIKYKRDFTYKIQEQLND